MIRADQERLTHALHGKKLHILGIGACALEGASMTWILDNLMSHPESTLTSVDTLEGGIEHQEADQAGEHDIPSLESRYRANVAKCEHVGKLMVVKARVMTPMWT